LTEKQNVIKQSLQKCETRPLKTLHVIYASEPILPRRCRTPIPLHVSYFLPHNLFRTAAKHYNGEIATLTCRRFEVSNASFDSIALCTGCHTSITCWSQPRGALMRSP